MCHRQALHNLDADYSIGLIERPCTAVLCRTGKGVIRIRTDSRTEFCGRPEVHYYQLYLALNDIEHTKTKVRHIQPNGICERFHQTILDSFAW